MNLELRLAAERAMVRRLSLLGLVDVVPTAYWSRRDAGDRWTARQHLDHAATADGLLRRILAAARAREPLSCQFEALRAELMEPLRNEDVDAVIGHMAAERATTNRELAAFEPGLLDEIVWLPGAFDAFGRPIGSGVRQLVYAWAEHDTVHEASIRRAITVPPDAGSLAVAARRRT